MHPIVIGDIETFKRFENGEEVTVHPVMLQDYIDRIKKDDHIVEVWYQSNTNPNPYHIGKVLNIGETVFSMPSDGPKAIAITVKLYEHRSPLH